MALFKNPFKTPKVTAVTTPTGGAPTTTTVGGGSILSGTSPWSLGAAAGGLLGGPTQTLIQAGQNASGALNTLGAQQAASQTSQAQNDAASAAATAAQKQAAEQAESKELLRQLTARRLMMLRQGLAGQQGRNLGLLRRHLAQRGALDSGSLGAGVTSLGNETSGLLAEGTQKAANQEAEGLLDLLNRSRAMQFSREEGAKSRDFEEYMARVKADLERRNAPSGIELFLQGLGNVGGNVGGAALGSWLGK